MQRLGLEASLGRLAWFEEWAADALTGSGRYGTDDGPLSFQDPSLKVLRDRFARARQRYQAEMVRFDPW